MLCHSWQQQYSRLHIYIEDKQEKYFLQHKENHSKRAKNNGFFLFGRQLNSSTIFQSLLISRISLFSLFPLLSIKSSFFSVRFCLSATLLQKMVRYLLIWLLSTRLMLNDSILISLGLLSQRTFPLPLWDSLLATDRLELYWLIFECDILLERPQLESVDLLSSLLEQRLFCELIFTQIRLFSWVISLRRFLRWLKYALRWLSFRWKRASLLNPSLPTPTMLLPKMTFDVSLIRRLLLRILSSKLPFDFDEPRISLSVSLRGFWTSIVDLMGGSRSVGAVGGATLHERMGRRDTDLFGFAL